MSASMTMAKKIQTQGLLSSSLSIDEETMLMQKQGIGTILGSDCERDTAYASSLRRTLSADMSSKKWLPQNGASPMKKIASSEQLLHSNTKNIAHSLSSSSSEGEEEDYEEKKELEAEAERERLEIWSSIQKNKKEEKEKAGQFDTWSSIMSLKAKDDVSKSLPVTPYIHPLVKRSKSTLSEKSLEICTESLGSETGSDGFSSYPPSETGDAEEDKEEEQQLQPLQQQQQQEKLNELAYEPEEELQVPRYNHATATKKSPPRSFPPPLPSLLSYQHGPLLHMRSHRDNGRLVLQAVSLPSQNNFCVQRQDGRLVLAFANHQDQEEEDADEVAEEGEDEENDAMMELHEEFGEFEEDDQEEKEHEGVEVEVEVEVEDDDETDEEDVEETEGLLEKAPLLSSGITTASVHGVALMMNKPGLVNRNPKWSEKLNQLVNFDNVNGLVEVEPSPVAQSLPPRPLIPKAQPVASAAAAASFKFNAYECYWRTKPTAKAGPVPVPLARQQNNNSSLKNNNSSKVIVSGDINPISNEQQQLLVLRGKNVDYLANNLKSCKDSRRSLLCWEHFCIATS